jgi:hypothetical protein
LNVKNIATALVKAQREFGPALKTNTNPHFRSKYADLSACVEAVIDALNANGIALIQQTHECTDGVIVETVFVHESGETMSSGKLHVPAAKHDPQGYGSALTYARRYSLMAACGIAPEDDDGNAASRKGPVAASFRSSPTMGAMEMIEDEDRRVYLEMLASVVIAKVKAGEVGFAHDKIEAEKFDSDEKTALWSLLDSKTRSALKKYNADQRATVSA